MSIETGRSDRGALVDWRRAEFVLTLFGFLAFFTLPIRLTTVYGGLPAHPLFVHVPVILIPVTIVAAVVFMFREDWFSRYGIALAAVSIVAMGAIFLTMQAGAALRGALNLQGRAASLISQHSQAAHILALVYVAFTATLIVTFAARRISGGMPTGLSIVDGLLSSRSMFMALRVALVLLAIGAGYMTFRTGDLGAKAVWAGRIQAAAAGGSLARPPAHATRRRLLRAGRPLRRPAKRSKCTSASRQDGLMKERADRLASSWLAGCTSSATLAESPVILFAIDLAICSCHGCSRASWSRRPSTARHAPAVFCGALCAPLLLRRVARVRASG